MRQVRPERFSIDECLLPALERLANLTDLDERLAAIRSTDFRGAEPEDVYSSITNAIVFSPLEVSVSRPYNIDRFPLYRARTHVTRKRRMSLCGERSPIPVPSIVHQTAEQIWPADLSFTRVIRREPPSPRLILLTATSSTWANGCCAVIVPRPTLAFFLLL